VWPAAQRMLSGKIEVNPTMVTVYASKSVLDTLSSVSTVFFEAKNVQDTLHRKIALKRMQGVKFIPDKVEVTIPVEEFTEKTLEIPIQGINVPNDLTMRTFPSKVSVSFFVVLSKFNDVKDSDFQATIDYSEFKNAEGNGKLKVNLSKVPSIVDNVRLNTSDVDVLMEEKAGR
jgi:YbbR domain-containing protein